MNRQEKVARIQSVYGKGPDGKNCKNCAWLVCHMRDRAWYKCRVYGTSHSDATDWCLSNPACGMYTEEETKLPKDFRTVTEIYKHKRYTYPVQHPREPEIEGQISMEELLNGPDCNS